MIEREQYYIDLYKPEYNICKIAGSLLGFKHSPETLKFKNRTSINSKSIILIDINNKTNLKYNSIRSAARDISVSHTTLLRYMNRNKLIKDIYLINRLNKYNYTLIIFIHILVMWLLFKQL